jgi:hypothetical protein
MICRLHQGGFLLTLTLFVFRYSMHVCVTASLLLPYFGLHPADFNFEQSNQNLGTSPFQPLPPSKLSLNLHNRL